MTHRRAIPYAEPAPPRLLLLYRSTVNGFFTSWSARAFALGAGYYIAGRLALLMAIPPGYATAVWPAAGLGLVGILALGPRAFPAIILGSFFVNINTGFDPTTTETLLRSIAIALSIACGAGAQAVAGAELVRRLVGYPNPFDEERDVVRLLLLGGPIACCVSATCGVLTLFMAGFVPASGLPFNWFTWWVGDTIGVLVFAPLLLAIIGEPRDSWKRRRWAVGVPPVFGFIMVVALFLSVSRREQQRLETEFVRRCEPIATALRATIAQAVQVGGATASFLRVVPSVDEAAFDRFAEDLLVHQPGVQGVSWVEPVSELQRPDWEATHGHVVSQRLSDGTLARASITPEHYVVSWIMPGDGNAVAVGYDLGSEATRLTTLEQARKTGAAVTSGLVHLVQGGGDADGVLIVEPVEPRGGFASTVLAADHLVLQAVSGLKTDGILLHIVDESEGIPIFSASGTPAEGQLWSTEIAVGSRTWLAEFRPTRAYHDAQRSWEAWGVLAFGLVLVALSEFALLVSTGREGRLAAAEDRATALLRAMPDAILRLGPDGSMRDYRPPGVDPSRTGEWSEASGLVSANVAVHFLDMVREVQSTGQPRRLEYRTPSATGARDFEARFVAGVGDDVLAVVRDVSAQKDAERQIRSALAEKEVLLREIHHRVKNNLQVVSSLLNLSEDRLSDPAARSALAATRERVRSIALVHDQLHRSADIAHVAFGAYLRALAVQLPAVVGDGSDRIRVIVSGDDVTLPLDVAMPCGLIVNELVTNAFLHAYPGENVGVVYVSIHELHGGRAKLVVRDNGLGAPEGWDPRQSAGTGLELVFTFAEQVRAEVVLAYSPGLSFTFTFDRETR